MGDWSGVYLRTVIGVQASTAALGYAAYSLAMAGGWFLGGRLLSALGPMLVLRLSGLSAAAGLALALLMRTPEGWTASHWNFSFLGRPAGSAVAGCRFWSDHRKQRPPCGCRSSKSLKRLYGRGLRFRKSPAPSPPCESFLFFSEPGSGEVDAK